MSEPIIQPQNVFIHAQALVESQEIGEGTRIWAFAHILDGCKIGRDCNICDHTYIEGGVTLGDRVTLKSGIYLWDGVTCENDVFLGPNVVFTNDLYPRSKQHLDKFVPTLVREGASIGANATILAGTTIGRYALIGIGSVVTRDVPDHGLAYGNPARLQGFVGRRGRRLNVEGDVGVCPESGERYRIENGACTPMEAEADG